MEEPMMWLQLINSNVELVAVEMYLSGNKGDDGLVETSVSHKFPRQMIANSPS